MKKTIVYLMLFNIRYSALIKCEIVQTMVTRGLRVVFLIGDKRWRQAPI